MWLHYLYMLCSMHTVNTRKSLAVLKFGGFVPNDMLNKIGRLKFGSLHCTVFSCTYMHTVEILATFNLAVDQHNIIPYKIFRLYIVLMTLLQ